MVVDEPVHIAAAPTVVVITGSAITVIVCVAVLIQLLAFLPVTVYVLVAVVEQVTVAPVVVLRLVAGDHV